MRHYIHAIHRTINSKIFYVCGDIFNVSHGLYDGVIAFLCVSHEFERVINMRCKNVIAILYNYNYQPKLKKEKIYSAVFKSLDVLKSAGCRNIAFHGIRTIDCDEKESERETINAIVEWGKSNDEYINRIYLVDMYDSYAKDFPNTVLSLLKYIED